MNVQIRPPLRIGFVELADQPSDPWPVESDGNGRFIRRYRDRLATGVRQSGGLGRCPLGRLSPTVVGLPRSGISRSPLWLCSATAAELMLPPAALARSRAGGIRARFEVPKHRQVLCRSGEALGEAEGGRRGHRAPRRPPGGGSARGRARGKRPQPRERVAGKRPPRRGRPRLRRSGTGPPCTAASAAVAGSGSVESAAPILIPSTLHQR